MKILAIALSFSCLLIGCSEYDFGTFGATYVSVKSEHRFYSMENTLKREREKNEIHIDETDSEEYPPYIIRDGQLFLLLFYGRKSQTKYYYPSRKNLAHISYVFPEYVDKNDPCLGVPWLRKNAKPRIDTYESFELKEQEINFQRHVASQGGFCDEEKAQK